MKIGHNVNGPNLKCGLLFYLFIITFYLFLIDNEKGIPHFKFASLDYGYSGVYLQKCKVTENPTLLIALLFCLKVGMSKNDKNLPWPLTLWPIFKIYHKIEFCNDTCRQNALWLNWWKITSVSHFGGSNHYTLH